MNFRKTFHKFSKLIILLVVFIIGYSLYYGLMERASAPFSETGATTGVNSGTPGDATPGTSGGPSGSAAVSSPDSSQDNTQDSTHDPTHVGSSPAASPDSTSGTTPSAATDSSPTAPSARPFTMPGENNYVMLTMKPSDIYKGSLLLINSKNYYPVPDDSAIVAVSVFMTPSYRVEENDIALDSSIIDPLNAMMDAFYAATGRDNITIISGYRTYTRQQEIFDDYTKLFGAAEAPRWASYPGYSEHHSGLAMDIGIFNGSAVKTFTGLGINTWFKENCHRFGFILRYTQEKTEITGTADEPWHFRYVGNPHAGYISAHKLCLEEYIDFIRGFSAEAPFELQYENDTYYIYHTTDCNIRIPFDCEFDVSGDNIDGFIVTIKSC